MTVRLETENGDAIDEVADPQGAILMSIPDPQSGLLIGYIDPYGDTVFNTLQAPKLLDEWRILKHKTRSDAERAVLDRVAKLIEVVATEPHHYVRFIGD